MIQEGGIDTTGFQLYPDIVGDDAEEAGLLKDAAEEALRFVRGFRWAPPVKRLYLAWGIGGILCLFLVKFERPIPGNPDDEIWVVVGDLPSVYLDTFVVDPETALETYCMIMEDWADAVLSGGDLSQCYPVDAAPTEEHALMLKSRLDTIRRDFIPNVSDFIGGLNHGSDAVEEQP